MGKYTENLRRRSEIFGNKKDGYCSICGNFGALTADHVPPKGCGVTQEVYFDTLSLAGAEHRRGHIIQGGVKFKTICGNCNNELLGLTYDPALSNLVHEITDHIKLAAKRIAFVPKFKIGYQPNLVARALIGHLLAAHAVQETTARMEKLGANDSLREYFLNPLQPFPAEWRLFCWPFLSRSQVILRHVALAEIGIPEKRDVLYGHIIKFFPFGFWIVKAPKDEHRINAIEITPCPRSDLNYTTNFTYDLRLAPHPQFPENPEGNWMVLTSDSQTSVAIPR